MHAVKLFALNTAAILCLAANGALRESNAQQLAFSSWSNVEAPIGSDVASSTAAIRLVHSEEDNVFTIPDVNVQFSAPSRYLGGFRDDYAEAGFGAHYSEFGFNFSEDRSGGLSVRSTGLTHVLAKPINETYGLQFSLTKKVFGSQSATRKLALGNAAFSYGLRYQQFYSGFGWLGHGSFLGTFESRTDTYTDVWGPQIALNWNAKWFGCQFQVISKVMVGQSLVDADQGISIETTSAPGLNQPAFAEPTTSRQIHNVSEVVTVSDLGASVSYAVTEHLGISLGYHAVYFSDYHSAADMQVWRLPSFGIDPSRSKDFFDDQIHASIEWRR